MTHECPAQRQILCKNPRKSQILANKSLQPAQICVQHLRQMANNSIYNGFLLIIKKNNITFRHRNFMVEWISCMHSFHKITQLAQLLVSPPIKHERKIKFFIGNEMILLQTISMSGMIGTRLKELGIISRE